MWEFYNPNPRGIKTGDCAVRAISKAMDIGWREAYSALTLQGFIYGDMPSSDFVWGSYLRQNGFEREVIPNTCPSCYTVEDFCRDYSKGTYVLKLNNHVATVKDGVLYDSWDSSGEVPQYFWHKER